MKLNSSVVDDCLGISLIPAWCKLSIAAQSEILDYFSIPYSFKDNLGRVITINKQDGICVCNTLSSFKEIIVFLDSVMSDVDIQNFSVMAEEFDLSYGVSLEPSISGIFPSPSKDDSPELFYKRITIFHFGNFLAEFASARSFYRQLQS